MHDQLKLITDSLSRIARGKPGDVSDVLALLSAPESGAEVISPQLELTARSNESVNFHLMLRDLLGGPAERWRAGPSRVLSLGCGRLREGLGVTALMTGVEFGRLSDQVEIFGVDVSTFEVEEARNLYQLVRRGEGGRIERRPIPGFHFMHGGGEQLGRIDGLPERFDLVYLRHQNFANPRSDWSQIFASGFARLAEGGRLLATSFFLEEHQCAVECLRGLGAAIEHEGENPRATLRHSGDRAKRISETWTNGWVVVARRP